MRIEAEAREKERLAELAAAGIEPAPEVRCARLHRNGFELTAKSFSQKRADNADSSEQDGAEQ
jgi:hypothetical protein